MRLSKNELDSFPRFGIVTEDFFALDSLCFFTGKNLKYLTEALNSEYAIYSFFNSVAVLDNGGFQMRQQYIENILLPPPCSDLFSSFDFTDEEIMHIRDEIKRRKREIAKRL